METETEKADDDAFWVGQALQAAVQRIHTYVTNLEEKVEGLQKKKGGG